MIVELTAELLQERRAAFPRPARFLESADSLVLRGNWQQAIAHLAVERAVRDFLVFESPVGSNRGPTPDSYNRRAGVVLGSPYCATSGSAWWEDVGLDVPPLVKRSSTDEWYWWAIKTQRYVSLDQWLAEPKLQTPGAMILYGDGKPANPAFHIGIVCRLDPFGTFEGNTSPDPRYSREGVCFTDKVFDLTKRDRPVLGFVLPFPLTQGA